MQHTQNTLLTEMQPLTLEPTATPSRLDSSQTQVPDGAKAIQELHQMFASFSKTIDVRMSKLESNVSQVLDVLLRNQRDTAEWAGYLNEGILPPSPAMSPLTKCLPPLALCSSACNSPEREEDENDEDEDDTSSAAGEYAPRSASGKHFESLHLKVTGLETKWYTKRPLTPFQVQLVNENDELIKDIDNLVISVALVSGTGIVVTQHLAHNDSLTFPMIDGEAEVVGLRFLAVSSRNGGHFKLKFTLEGSPSVSIPTVTPSCSEEMQVLSERLKNEHKAESILDLASEDTLARVPGIGKKYATKLAEQGLVTVRDLALLDSAPSSRTKRLEILNAVRRDRGALTEAKLVELLRDAKTVLRREEAETRAAAAAEPPAKRQRTESPQKKPSQPPAQQQQQQAQTQHLLVPEMFHKKHIPEISQSGWQIPSDDDEDMLLNPHAFEAPLNLSFAF